MRTAFDRKSVVAGSRGDRGGPTARVGEVEAVVADEHGERRRCRGRAPRAGRARRAPAGWTCRPRWPTTTGRAPTSSRDARGGGEPVAHDRPAARPSAGAARRWRPRARAPAGAPAASSCGLGGGDPVVDRGADGRGARSATSRSRTSRATPSVRPQQARRAPRAVRGRRARRRPTGSRRRRARRWSGAQRVEDVSGVRRSTRAAGPSQEGDDAAHPTEAYRWPHVRPRGPRTARHQRGRPPPPRPGLGGGGLDHHPDERLRAAAAHAARGRGRPARPPTAAISSASAAGEVHRPCRRPGRCAAPAGAGSWRRRPARRAARPARATTSSSCTAVSRPSPVVARSREDDVPALLAAERRGPRRPAPRARSGRRRGTSSDLDAVVAPCRGGSRGWPSRWRRRCPWRAGRGRGGRWR